MGNQLVSLAPSQIFPVEHYIADIVNEVRYDSSLGSTRFFKVAKCSSRVGPVVAKVFVIHDPSLPMRDYGEKLEELRNILEPTYNCLPFLKTILTDKAGFILRQYVKYNAYDRLSTRPFLTTVEKKWITYQLMSAVDQAHGLGVCHGDIKLENVVMTSWNWVMLTDFAPFKPTFLPEDNPADFSYFFDTSRRRTCYIAPERFKIRSLDLQAASLDKSGNPTCLPDYGEEFHRGELTPEMDVFSVGCTLAELFLDGQPIFDFSQLLAYRSDEYSPDALLEKIEDVDIRDMIKHMISKDPSKRSTMSKYLSKQRGKIFPEYFYSILQSYMGMFSHIPIISSDQKISRIHNDLKSLELLLSEETELQERIDEECLLIMTSVVTSCIRDLRLTVSKLRSIKVLNWLVSHQSQSDLVLDRIIPFYIYYLSSPVCTVRYEAVDSLVKALMTIKSVPRSEVNLFPEYIFPALLPLCQDPSIRVRSVLAKNLSKIGRLAIDFLDMVVDSQGRKDGWKDGATGGQHIVSSYDTEMNTMLELVGQAATLLLEDQTNYVKQTLVRYSASELAVYFGRQKANDVLMSHMITFLNDKSDAPLRYSFFDSIVGVAYHIGWQCSQFLKPLLQQGFSDPEEFVVVRTIQAVACLCKEALMDKVSMFELYNDILPFLVHPNLWIRHAACGVIVSVAECLDEVEVQVKVIKRLRPFLTQDIFMVERSDVVFAYLKEPIPRAVFDDILRFFDVEGFIKFLEDRQNARRIAKASNQEVVYGEVPHQYVQTFLRLREAGMLSSVEDLIIKLAEHITKVAGQGHLLANTKTNDAANGVIEIGLENCKKFTVQLIEDGPLDDSLVTGVVATEEGVGEAIGGVVGFWGTTTVPVAKAGQSKAAAPPANYIEWKSGKRRPRDHELVTMSSPCRVNLQNLITAKKVESASLAIHEEKKTRSDKPTTAWKPRGTLVAHLTEHKDRVTAVANLPDTSLFVSTSRDGTVRIWDSAKMEGRNIANKSLKHVERRFPQLDIAASSFNQNIVGAEETGVVWFLSLGSEKTTLTAIQRVVDPDDLGTPFKVAFQDQTHAPLIFFATSFGRVFAWDIRQPSGYAMKFQTHLRYGVTTGMCLDKDEFWLATGTSDGVVTAWDLRFQLQVSTFTHPTGARVRTMIPGEKGGQLVMSVQGNNEVNFWNVESGTRQQMLWASPVQPLTQATPSQQSVNTIIKTGDNYITGGSDCRLRYWNPKATSDCTIVGMEGNIAYRSRLIDGMEVIQETGKAAKKIDESKMQVDNHHQNWITGLTIVEGFQKLLVSSGMDGVVKVWK